MDFRCVKHQFETGEAMCRHCGDWFCGECLVYSFGPSKPPFCVGCALAASGVRSNAAKRPKVSRRERKRREQEAAAAMQQVRAQQQAREPVAIDWDSPEDAWPHDPNRVAS